MHNIAQILDRYLSHINLPSVNIIDVIEIILISFFVYQFMVWIKYTRAYTLLKGLLIIGAFLLIAYIFKMNTTLWIVSEETGQVSVAQEGKLTRDLNSSELREILEKAQNKKVVDNSKLRQLLKGRVKHEGKTNE